MKEQESKKAGELGAAAALVEQKYPLPRCKHGRALRDHAGDELLCPDGCLEPTNGVDLLAPKLRRLRG